VIYVAVFFAGMAFPHVAWWTIAVLNDYVYMPLVWIPRHKRRCAKMWAETERSGAK